MLGLTRRRPRTLPYGMFDRDAYGLAAKQAQVLERIYHKGHDQAWDGREVLADLIAKHGRPTLAQREREALGRVFAIIMWGELAAWRISAELADEIEVFEAKMAATSQAFDEARHFYVMHDYLEALGGLPDRLDRRPQRLLERVMNADNLAKKLLGMQLTIEPIALTLFHIVRELDLEPVLSGLMPYYERDEARHVALGVKYLPAMLGRMSARERAGVWAFQLELLNLEVLSSVSVARDLDALGLDPRLLVHVGKGKQMRAMEMVMDAVGMDSRLTVAALGRWGDVLAELTIPDGAPLGTRLQRCWRALVHGDDVSDVTLTPDVRDEQVPFIRPRRPEGAAA